MTNDSSDNKHSQLESECFYVLPSTKETSQQQQNDDEFGCWDWEETLSVATANTSSADFLVDSLPPQLHPAVSLGLHRVSSCAYFSLQGSDVMDTDLYSLSSTDGRGCAAADWLYHDILMSVLMFLDAKSLAAFSETSRRSNFEVYYFLQLQLQRALLEDDLSSNLTMGGSFFGTQHSTTSTTTTTSTDNDRIASIAGSWSISRLASLNAQEAHDVVQEYLDSNCTLRTMPLSHSLAYIREVLRRNGFPGGGGGGGHQQTLTTSAQAALLIGLVGAATVMSGNVNVEVVESFGNELPNMLFKVGFVGSLMGAARHRWENQNNSERTPQQNTHQQAREEPQSAMMETAEHMRETAEQMARALQEMLQQIRTTTASAANNNNNNNNRSGRPVLPPTAHTGSISRRMYDAFLAASGRPFSADTAASTASSLSQQGESIFQLMSPNPYDHLPQQQQQNQTENERSSNHQGVPSGSGDTSCSPLSSPTNDDDVKGRPPPPPEKMPSGCVGAYFRAIHRASKSITRIVKQQRRERFEALPDNETVSRSFIDASCSDASLYVVKDLVQARSTIDADGFYVGSDGTETCALHASAFHGATKVLEFLCGGIDERNASRDEGLCCVNLQDANGWTALHFAAGANCVESARILADRGADLTVVAENGYTPLQWAQRLSNHEVAEELRRRLEQADPSSNSRWIAGASQPLSMIAHRFFAMIPTH